MADKFNDELRAAIQEAVQRLRDVVAAADAMQAWPFYVDAGNPSYR